MDLITRATNVLSDQAWFSQIDTAEVLDNTHVLVIVDPFSGPVTTAPSLVIVDVRNGGFMVVDPEA